MPEPTRIEKQSSAVLKQVQSRMTIVPPYPTPFPPQSLNGPSLPPLAQRQDEIAESINSGAGCSFDYLASVAAAGCIACAGLVTVRGAPCSLPNPLSKAGRPPPPFQDSSVSVVASMLLSPLMGPILAITFGVAVKDRQLCNVGWHAELWGIVVAFLTGVLVATVMAPLYPMEAWDASADEEAHFTGSDLAIGN